MIGLFNQSLSFIGGLLSSIAVCLQLGGIFQWRLSSIRSCLQLEVTKPECCCLLNLFFQRRQPLQQSLFHSVSQSLRFLQNRPSFISSPLYTISYHPIPSHTISYHLIPSHTIPYHPICLFVSITNVSLFVCLYLKLMLVLDNQSITVFCLLVKHSITVLVEM